MRRGLLVLVMACGAAPPAPATGDIVDEMLARLDRAHECDRPGSVWCIATRGWATGTAPDLPEGVLVGITVGLERGQTDGDLVLNPVGFSVLAVRGGHVLVTDIPPQSAGEQRMLDEAAAAVTEAVAGRSPQALIAKPLFDFAQKVPAKYPLARARDEWRYSGQAHGHIRRVGDVWVVVEIPKEGPPGVFVSLYTDRSAAKNLPR